MKTRFQRWGNDLAVRIPKSFAKEVDFRADSPVDLRLFGGALVVEPASPQPPALADLLSRVRKSNINAEIDAGSAQGRETW